MSIALLIIDMVRYQFVAMEGYLKMIVMSVVYRVEMIMFPELDKVILML